MDEKGPAQAAAVDDDSKRWFLEPKHAALLGPFVDFLGLGAIFPLIPYFVKVGQGVVGQGVVGSMALAAGAGAGARGRGVMRRGAVAAAASAAAWRARRCRRPAVPVPVLSGRLYRPLFSGEALAFKSSYKSKTRLEFTGGPRRACRRAVLRR